MIKIFQKGKKAKQIILKYKYCNIYRPPFQAYHYINFREV